MKNLYQYICESSNAYQQPRADVIALENGKLDWKQYISKHFNDKCQIWLKKSNGLRSGKWDSIHIMIPYPENYFVEIRLRFNNFPDYLIQVIGHRSENEIDKKVPNHFLEKILNTSNITYYNAIFSDRPERYTSTYAKYL